MVGLTISEEMGHLSLKISEQEYENGQTPPPFVKVFHRILDGFPMGLCQSGYRVKFCECEPRNHDTKDQCQCETLTE